MKNNLAALFDMDGVIIDTETQYSVFWRNMAKELNIGVPNFETVIKGTTLPNILNTYCSHLTEEQTTELVRKIDDLEENMIFEEILGALTFVRNLKNDGIKVGLVTSSLDNKMEKVNEVLHLDQIFDTIVTGSRIRKGKPAPDCYLLAAKDLGIDPSQCIVFEDAFTGIDAGNAALMKVVGLSTTHPPQNLRDCINIIPNFEGLTSLDFQLFKEIKGQ